MAFFYNYGVNTVILRNRLRRDGYMAETDAVYDALQAIAVIARARGRGVEDRPAEDRHHGILGRRGTGGAGGRCIYEEFDATNSAPGDPLAARCLRVRISSGSSIPAPRRSPQGATPTIPRNAPPTFIASAGLRATRHTRSGRTNISRAMLARACRTSRCTSTATACTATASSTASGDRRFGTWQDRFVDWFRDLGFLEKPGVETKAERDVAAFVPQAPLP